MFSKLSELKKDDRFRFVDKWGLPDGRGYKFNWFAGGQYSASVDQEGVVSTQYFDKDVEVFIEREAQLDV